MKLKEFYYTACDFRGCPKGTKIRIHDWNDKEVQIAIRGSLEWIPMDVFNFYFEEEGK